MMDYETPKLSKVAIAPLSSLKLFTLAEAKTHLRLESTFTADDAYLNDLESVCTTWIENYCRRPIKRQTLDYHFTLSSRLKIPVGPVTINSIQSGNETISADDYTSLGDDRETLIEFHERPTYEGYSPAPIKVNAAVGWSSIPDLINRAALVLASDLYSYRSSAVVTRSTPTPASVVMLLEGYRL